jgi:hypothetical protein
MPGLVPGIHVFKSKREQGVDGRDKPGHDDNNSATSKSPTTAGSNSQ